MHNFGGIASLSAPSSLDCFPSAGDSKRGSLIIFFSSPGSWLLLWLFNVIVHDDRHRRISDCSPLLIFPCNVCTSLFFSFLVCRIRWKIIVALHHIYIHPYMHHQHISICIHVAIIHAVQKKEKNITAIFLPAPCENYLLVLQLVTFCIPLS